MRRKLYIYFFTNNNVSEQAEPSKFIRMYVWNIQCGHTKRNYYYRKSSLWIGSFVNCDTICAEKGWPFVNGLGMKMHSIFMLQTAWIHYYVVYRQALLSALCADMWSEWFTMMHRTSPMRTFLYPFSIYIIH